MQEVQIEVDGERVRTRTPLPRLLFIPLGAVVEEFPASGAPAAHPRRDQRPGKFEGRLEPAPHNAEGFSIRSTWAEPLAGAACDAYSLSPDGDTLEIAAELCVEGRCTRYK